MKTALLAMVLLTGCASLPQGLEMTEEERAACAAAGCSVWTMQELQELVQRAMAHGYQQGRKSL